MIPGRAELLRRRRCRLLIFGMVLGVLLPIYERTWVALAIGVAGIALLLFVYRRECRHEAVRESSQGETHTRAPEA